MNNIRRVHTE